MKEKLSLEMRVRLASEGKGLLPKYNLAQFKNKKERHIEICKKLISLSESNGNFPITVLVYLPLKPASLPIRSTVQAAYNIDFQVMPQQ